MEICITPSPLVEPTLEYVAFVEQWVRWTQPYFEDEGHLIVDLCRYAQATIHLAVAAFATMQSVHEFVEIEVQDLHTRLGWGGSLLAWGSKLIRW